MSKPPAETFVVTIAGTTNDRAEAAALALTLASSAGCVLPAGEVPHDPPGVLTAASELSQEGSPP